MIKPLIILLSLLMTHEATKTGLAKKAFRDMIDRGKAEFKHQLPVVARANYTEEHKNGSDKPYYGQSFDVNRSTEKFMNSQYYDNQADFNMAQRSRIEAELEKSRQAAARQRDLMQSMKFQSIENQATEAVVEESLINNEEQLPKAEWVAQLEEKGYLLEKEVTELMPIYDFMRTAIVPRSTNLPVKYVFWTKNELKTNPEGLRNLMEQSRKMFGRNPDVKDINLLMKIYQKLNEPKPAFTLKVINRSIQNLNHMFTPLTKEISNNIVNSNNAINKHLRDSTKMRFKLIVPHQYYLRRRKQSWLHKKSDKNTKVEVADDKTKLYFDSGVKAIAKTDPKSQISSTDGNRAVYGKKKESRLFKKVVEPQQISSKDSNNKVATPDRVFKKVVGYDYNNKMTFDNQTKQLDAKRKADIKLIERGTTSVQERQTADQLYEDKQNKTPTQRDEKSNLAVREANALSEVNEEKRLVDNRGPSAITIDSQSKSLNDAQEAKNLAVRDEVHVPSVMNDKTDLKLKQKLDNVQNITEKQVPAIISAEKKAIQNLEDDKNAPAFIGKMYKAILNDKQPSGVQTKEDVYPLSTINSEKTSLMVKEHEDKNLQLIQESSLPSVINNQNNQLLVQEQGKKNLQAQEKTLVPKVMEEEVNALTQIQAENKDLSVIDQQNTPAMTNKEIKDIVQPKYQTAMQKRDEAATPSIIRDEKHLSVPDNNSQLEIRPQANLSVVRDENKALLAHQQANSLQAFNKSQSPIMIKPKNTQIVIREQSDLQNVNQQDTYLSGRTGKDKLMTLQKENQDIPLRTAAASQNSELTNSHFTKELPTIINLINSNSSIGLDSNKPSGLIDSTVINQINDYDQQTSKRNIGDSFGHHSFAPIKYDFSHTIDQKTSSLASGLNNSAPVLSASLVNNIIGNNNIEESNLIQRDETRYVKLNDSELVELRNKNPNQIGVEVNQSIPLQKHSNIENKSSMSFDNKNIANLQPNMKFDAKKLHQYQNYYPYNAMMNLNPISNHYFLNYVKTNPSVFNNSVLNSNLSPQLYYQSNTGLNSQSFDNTKTSVDMEKQDLERKIEKKLASLGIDTNKQHEIANNKKVLLGLDAKTAEMIAIQKIEQPQLPAAFVEEFLQLRPENYPIANSNIILKDILRIQPFLSQNFALTPQFQHEYLLIPYINAKHLDSNRRYKSPNKRTSDNFLITTAQFKNKVESVYGKDPVNYPNYVLSSCDYKFVPMKGFDYNRDFVSDVRASQIETLKYDERSFVNAKAQLLAAQDPINVIQYDPQEKSKPERELDTKDIENILKASNGSTDEVKSNHLSPDFITIDQAAGFQNPKPENKKDKQTKLQIPKNLNYPNIFGGDLQETDYINKKKEELLDLPFYNLILDIEDFCIEYIDIGTCGKVGLSLTSYYNSLNPIQKRRHRDIEMSVRDVISKYSGFEGVVGGKNFLNDDTLFAKIFKNFSESFARMEYLSYEYVMVD